VNLYVRRSKILRNVCFIISRGIGFTTHLRQLGDASRYSLGVATWFPGSGEEEKSGAPTRNETKSLSTFKSVTDWFTNIFKIYTYRSLKNVFCGGIEREVAYYRIHGFQDLGKKVK
jgi:hypothetical protein